MIRAVTVKRVVRGLMVWTSVLLGSFGVYLGLDGILQGERLLGVLGYWWSVLWSYVMLANALKSFQHTNPSPGEKKQ